MRCLTTCSRATAEHYLERKVKMLRSQGKDLGSVGAFIDTTGSKRKKNQGYHVRTDITTEEEEQLGALVFGKQPFKPRDTGGEIGGTDSEEEEEEVSRWIMESLQIYVVCPFPMGQLHNPDRHYLVP